MLLLYMPPIKDIDGFTYVDLNNVNYSFIEKNTNVWDKLTSKFILKMKETLNISDDKEKKIKEKLNNPKVIKNAIDYFKKIHEHDKNAKTHGGKKGVKKKSRRRKKKKRAKKTKRRYKGGVRSEMEGVAVLFTGIIGIALGLAGIGYLWDQYVYALIVGADADDDNQQHQQPQTTTPPQTQTHQINNTGHLIEEKTRAMT